MEKKIDITEEDVDKLMKVFAELNSTNVWSRVKRDDFTIRRFAMGYSNDISCCVLTDQARLRLGATQNIDYPAIVVKFVPDVIFFSLNRIETTAVKTTISENGLSPRLLYINEKCCIYEYIQSQNYNQDDDLNVETVKKIARVLGRFHSLKPPISIDGFHAWNKMTDNIGELPISTNVFKNEFIEAIVADDELKDKYGSAFDDLDLKQVFAANKIKMENVKSPFVFTHGDFNRGNRLVKKETRSDGTIETEIYLVDFEYSTYNYRGYDLGRYFSNYRHKEDMFGDEGFPTDDEMKLFLEEYRQECAAVQGESYLKRSENSIEQLIKESKIFVLHALTIDFLFCLMMYQMDPKSPKKHYFLQSASNRYNAYKKVVKQFTEDGTFMSISKIGSDVSN